MSEEDLCTSKGNPSSLWSLGSVSNTCVLPGFWSTAIWSQWMTFPICSTRNTWFHCQNNFSLDLLKLYSLQVSVFPSHSGFFTGPIAIFQMKCSKGNARYTDQREQVYVLVNSPVKGLKKQILQAPRQSLARATQCTEFLPWLEPSDRDSVLSSEEVLLRLLNTSKCI